MLPGHSNSLYKLLILVLASLLVLFTSSCSSPEDSDSDTQEPTPNTMVSGLVEGMGQDLLDAGYSESQVNGIKSGCYGELKQQGLYRSTSIASVSTATLKGAQLALAESNSDVTTDIAKSETISIYIKSILAYLPEHVDTTSNGGLSAIYSNLSDRFFSSGDDTSADTYSMIFQKLAAEVIKNLDDAGISTAGIKAATNAALHSFTENIESSGVASEDLEEMVQIITHGAVTSLDETELENGDMNDAIGEVVKGALSGLRDSGMENGELGDIADDVTLGAVKGLMEAGVQQADLDTCISHISLAVKAGLENAGFSNEEIEAIQLTVYDATQEGKSDLLQNERPIAIADNFETDEDASLSITLSGSDPENAALTFLIIGQPVHGYLIGTPPEITYVPSDNFNGVDSFSFLVNDGDIKSSIATCNISVESVNDAPVALVQNIVLDEDNSHSITLSGTDVEQDDLSYQVITNPLYGSLSGIAPDIIYTPDSNFYGPDSFSFRVNDGSLDSTSDAVVSLTVNSVNDSPTTQGLALEMDENSAQSLSLIASDIELASLVYTVVDQPQHGVLSGTFPNLVYTPTAEYFGSDSFSFKVNDGSADSNISTVAINVVEVSDCTTTQSGSLLDPNTFGRAGCGNATNNVTIQSGHIVTWDGTGGTFIGDFFINDGGTLAISGGSADISGDMALAGGSLSISTGVTLTGDLLLIASSTLNIGAAKIFTYLGQEFDIGSNTLVLTGNGTIDNSNDIKLNKSDSILRIDGAGYTISKVTVEGENLVTGLLDIQDNVSIGSLDLLSSSRVAIADGKILRITDEAGISESASLILLENGTMEIGRNLSIAGTLSPGNVTLDLRGTDLFLANDLNTEGTVILTDRHTRLGLLARSTITTDQPIQFREIHMYPGSSELVLGSSATDLFVWDSFNLNSSIQALHTGDADFGLSGPFTILDGQFTSTGGLISFQNNAAIMGGTMDLSGSELVLYTECRFTGGRFESPDSISLQGDVILNNLGDLLVQDLSLNDNTLLLDGTNLTVANPFVLDHSNEVLNSQNQDLTLNAAVSISNGGITSTGGTITLSGSQTGGVLSLSDSTLKLNGNLEVFSSGFTPPTDLVIDEDSTLSGTGDLSIYSLVINEKSFTLSDNLTVHSRVSMDSIEDSIITGSHDLNLRMGVFITAGSISSTGGEITLSGNAAGGLLDLTDSQLTLNGDLEIDSSTMTAPTVLHLVHPSSLTGGGHLTIPFVDLNNHALTLGLNLTIENDVVLDNDLDVIHTGANNLTLLSSPTFTSGTISSTSGIITIPSTTIEDGYFEIPNSNLILKGSLDVSGASGFTPPDDLVIAADNVSLVGGVDVSVDTLSLSGNSLTLSSTNLTITNQVNLTNANEKIFVGTNSLTLENGFSMTNGAIESTGGSLTLFGVSTGGKLDLSDSYLTLNGDLDLQSISIFTPPRMLILQTNATLIGAGDISIGALELNDKEFRLANTNLTLDNLLMLDHPDEKLKSGICDLSFTSNVQMSDGEISSSGGTVSLQGVMIEGGTIDLSGSTMVMNEDLNFSNATFTSPSHIVLNDDGTLSGAGDVSVQTLTLNDSQLSLVDTNLTVDDGMVIDHSNEKILTGDNNLTLNAPIDMSDGTISSTGGAITLFGSVYGGGYLDLRGSTLSLPNDLDFSSIQHFRSPSILSIANDVTIVGNLENTDLSVDTLKLNDHVLTLEHTDLVVRDRVDFDYQGEAIVSDTGGLTLINGFTLSEGGISKTGGTITLSGSATGGSLGLSGSELVLNANLELSNLEHYSPPDNLAIVEDVTLEGAGNLTVSSLNLNNHTLVMKSDLSITNQVILDNQNEGIVTDSNLEFTGGIVMSSGIINASTGQNVSLSGSITGGELRAPNAMYASLNGDLVLAPDILVTTDSTWQTNGYILTFPRQTTFDGFLNFNGGTLEVDNDLLMTNDIYLGNDATIDVLTGRSLKYEGGLFRIGSNNLTLSGGGSIENDDSSGFALNSPLSVLTLTGEGGSIGAVGFNGSASSGKIELQSDFVIHKLVLVGDAEIEIAAGKRLNVGNLQSSFSASELTVSGSGDLLLHDITLLATLDIDGDITLAPDATLYVMADATFGAGGDLTFGDGLSISDGAHLTLEDNDGTYTVAFSGGVTIEGTDTTDRIVLAGDESLILDYPVPDATILAQVTNSGSGTINPSDGTAPDVLAFVASPGDGFIDLSWEIDALPVNSVMIRRSTSAFPDTTTDGDLIYTGLDDSTTDSDGVSNGTVYYYTAFAENNSGEYSAGVHAHSVATFVASGLVAYYQFNGNARDSSPYGNHGLIFGDVEATVDVNGTSGNALVFDGEGDYIEIDNPVVDDFTISLWVNVCESNGEGLEHWYNGASIVDGKIGDDQYDFGIAETEGGFLFGTGGPDTSIPSPEEYEPGVWRYLSVTREKNSGTLKLFIDGFLAATDTGGTESLSAPNFLSIGGAPFGGRYFLGSLDELRLYNRQLTEMETFQLYGKEKGNPFLQQPDTGQNSYPGSWPVQVTGADAHYSANPQSITDNGDGTATDNVTGLVWQIARSSSPYDWYDAYNYCDTTADSLLPGNNWRLPNYYELLDMIDYKSTGSGFYSVFSGYAGHYDNYWTSDLDASDADEAWAVMVEGSIAHTVPVTTPSYYARCVRGE